MALEHNEHDIQELFDTRPNDFPINTEMLKEQEQDMTNDMAADICLHGGGQWLMDVIRPQEEDPRKQVVLDLLCIALSSSRFQDILRIRVQDIPLAYHAIYWADNEVFGLLSSRGADLTEQLDMTFNPADWGKEFDKKDALGIYEECTRRGGEHVKMVADTRGVPEHDVRTNLRWMYTALHHPITTEEVEMNRQPFIRNPIDTKEIKSAQQRFQDEVASFRGPSSEVLEALALELDSKGDYEEAYQTLQQGTWFIDFVRNDFLTWEEKSGMRDLLMVAKKARPTVLDEDFSNSKIEAPLLIWAILGGDEEMLDWLLTNGVDQNARVTKCSTDAPIDITGMNAGEILTAMKTALAPGEDDWELASIEAMERKLGLAITTPLPQASRASVSPSSIPNTTIPATLEGKKTALFLATEANTISGQLDWKVMEALIRDLVALAKDKPDEARDFIRKLYDEEGTHVLWYCFARSRETEGSAKKNAVVYVRTLANLCHPEILLRHEEMPDAMRQTDGPWEKDFSDTGNGKASRKAQKEEHAQKAELPHDGTPLHWAVILEDESMVEALLAVGARPEAQTDFRRGRIMGWVMRRLEMKGTWVGDTYDVVKALERHLQAMAAEKEPRPSDGAGEPGERLERLARIRASMEKVGRTDTTEKVWQWVRMRTQDSLLGRTASAANQEFSQVKVLDRVFKGKIILSNEEFTQWWRTNQLVICTPGSSQYEFRINESRLYDALSRYAFSPTQLRSLTDPEGIHVLFHVPIPKRALRFALDLDPSMAREMRRHGDSLLVRAIRHEDLDAVEILAAYEYDETKDGAGVRDACSHIEDERKRKTVEFMLRLGTYENAGYSARGRRNRVERARIEKYRDWFFTHPITAEKWSDLSRRVKVDKAQGGIDAEQLWRLESPEGVHAVFAAVEGRNISNGSLMALRDMLIAQPGLNDLTIPNLGRKWHHNLRRDWDILGYALFSTYAGEGNIDAIVTAIEASEKEIVWIGQEVGEEWKKWIALEKASTHHIFLGEMAKEQGGSAAARLLERQVAKQMTITTDIRGKAGEKGIETKVLEYLDQGYDPFHQYRLAPSARLWQDRLAATPFIPLVKNKRGDIAQTIWKRKLHWGVPDQFWRDMLDFMVLGRGYAQGSALVDSIISSGLKIVSWECASTLRTILTGNSSASDIPREECAKLYEKLDEVGVHQATQRNLTTEGTPLDFVPGLSLGYLKRKLFPDKKMINSWAFTQSTLPPHDIHYSREDVLSLNVPSDGMNILPKLLELANMPIGKKGADRSQYRPTVASYVNEKPGDDYLSIRFAPPKGSPTLLAIAIHLGDAQFVESIAGSIKAEHITNGIVRAAGRGKGDLNAYEYLQATFDTSPEKKNELERIGRVLSGIVRPPPPPPPEAPQAPKSPSKLSRWAQAAVSMVSGGSGNQPPSGPPSGPQGGNAATAQPIASRLLQGVAAASAPAAPPDGDNPFNGIEKDIFAQRRKIEEAIRNLEHAGDRMRAIRMIVGMVAQWLSNGGEFFPDSVDPILVASMQPIGREEDATLVIALLDDIRIGPRISRKMRQAMYQRAYDELWLQVSRALEKRGGNDKASQKTGLRLAPDRLSYIVDCSKCQYENVIPIDERHTRIVCGRCVTINEVPSGGIEKLLEDTRL